MENQYIALPLLILLLLFLFLQTGDKYHHAQGNYFDKGIYTEDRIPRYKLVDGQAQERTEEEIQADRDAIPSPPPTEQEQLRADLDFIAAMTGVEL